MADMDAELELTKEEIAFLLDNFSDELTPEHLALLHQVVEDVEEQDEEPLEKELSEEELLLLLENYDDLGPDEMARLEALEPGLAEAVPQRRRDIWSELGQTPRPVRGRWKSEHPKETMRGGLIRQQLEGEE